MEHDISLPEEELGLLTMTDNDGNTVTFEYLDCIEYQGKEYLIVMPLSEEEQVGVVIFEIEPIDEENECYRSVDDDTAAAVYAIFREKFSDLLTFVD